MCGLVGVVSTEGFKSAPNRVKYFRHALIADSIRGPHSTGFFGIDKEEGKLITMKKALHAGDFLDLKTVDNYLSNVKDKKVLIGHNRWATMGGISNETAHPFTHDHITLVHNGTLDYYKDLEGSDKFTVDSEIITYALSKADDPIKVLESLDGAYALIWWDDKIKKLRTARNDQRPLHFAYVKKENTMLIASEAGMLAWLAEKNSLEVEKIWELAPGKLVTFDLENLKEYEVKNFTVLDIWGYGWKNYNSNDYSYTSKSSNSSDKLKSLGLEAGEVITVSGDDFFPYSSSSKNGSERSKWGKLISTYTTDKKVDYTVEINGIHENRGYEMIGYMLDVEVVSTHTAHIGNKIETRILAKNPQYRFLDKDDCASDDKETNVVDLSSDNVDTGDTYERYGPFNSLISQERWEDLIADGCSFCGSDIDVEDDDETGWDADGKPICKHCLTYSFSDVQ